ncbi:MAG: LPS-assembly protein LptD [Deltaproteobacteria bacterium]|nr:LPS-assembly protein LptD [Deltaproteobacteria bacterium]
MRKGCMLLSMLLCSFLYGDFSFASVRDMPERVDIEADSLAYDSDTETYRASGNVVITFDSGYIKADDVILDKMTSEATAEGHVFIKSGKDILEGEKVRFNITDDTGTISGGKVFFDRNHLYLRGETIEKKGEATYFLKSGQATTCDGENPDWRFTGRELEVTTDGYGTVKHGTFQVKGIPILYIPYLIFPAKTTRQTGLLFPRIAYSRDKLGWDVGIPFYWAVSENVDATFYQRYMDKRGFQEGAELRYIVSKDSYGMLYGDYLHDTMEVSDSGEDVFLRRDWKNNNNRWSYYLDHMTTFSPGFYLKTDIKKVSDRWYFRDFDSYNYYMAHYKESNTRKFDGVSFDGDKSLTSLNSTVRLVKDWSLFNATALMEYTDNFQSYSNDETLQKYPEVTFTGIRQPVLESPLDFELESSYGYYYRTTGYSGQLLDLYPVFSLPLGFSDYLEFTPSLGLRETGWRSSYGGDTVGEKDINGSREMYTIGATLSSEVYRVFDVGGQVVDKIRHGFRPELAYTYIPYVDQEDVPDFLSNITETNSMTYSLTNIFIARLKDESGGITYREFLKLKLSQSYNIKEARRDINGSSGERRPLGTVSAELDFAPFQYFSLDADAQFDVNSGEWKKLNSRFDIRDHRGDVLTAEYRYTQDSVEEINLSLKARTTERLDLIYVLKKNELDSQTLEATYAIDYHKQCWGAEFSYSDSPDDRRFMVIFSLYGLGKIGSLTGRSLEW